MYVHVCECVCVCVSDGQIQIMILFKSWFKHFLLFDLSAEDLIWSNEIWFVIWFLKNSGFALNVDTNCKLFIHYLLAF